MFCLCFNFDLLSPQWKGFLGPQFPVDTISLTIPPPLSLIPHCGSLATCACMCTSACISGMCGCVCMNLSHKREPELESQSIAALGPEVLSFLSACNRILNGMSVWCGFCLVSFLISHPLPICRLFSFSCLFYFIEDDYFCLPCEQALGRTCLMQKRKRKKKTQNLIWVPFGL